MKGRLFSTAVVIASISGVLSHNISPAHAAFPGSNGRIAYYFRQHIATINPDGTDKHVLVRGAGPRWSPDGTKVLYVHNNDLFIIDADGNGSRRLTRGSRDSFSSWSPDGSHVVFERHTTAGEYALMVIGSDGSGARRVGFGIEPSWSPGGTEIAFHGGAYNGGIFVMRPDGSNVKQLTSGPDFAPDWSPDGSRIIFTRYFDYSDNVTGDLFVMKANGTALKNVTHSRARSEEFPCWSPDGMRIAFQGSRPPYSPRIFTMNEDGSDTRMLTHNSRISAGAGLPNWQPLLIGTGSL